jgi:Flp pilus assembly protein TadG
MVELTSICISRNIYEDFLSRHRTILFFLEGIYPLGLPCAGHYHRCGNGIMRWISFLNSSSGARRDRHHDGAPAKFRRRSGNAAIEFTLLAPALLLMLVGTMDFARIFFGGIAMENAARAGVQYGALSPGKAGDTDGIVAAALADAAAQGLSGVTASARTFCSCVGTTSDVSCSLSTCGGQVPNGYVQATVQYTFNSVLRYPGLPANVVISRTARMRVQ